MAHKVTILIEKDEHGYYAYAPELEGYQAQGDTLERKPLKMHERL